MREGEEEEGGKLRVGGGIVKLTPPLPPPPPLTTHQVSPLGGVPLRSAVKEGGSTITPARDPRSRERRCLFSAAFVSAVYPTVKSLPIISTDRWKRAVVDTGLTAAGTGRLQTRNRSEETLMHTVTASAGAARILSCRPWARASMAKQGLVPLYSLLAAPLHTPSSTSTAKTSFSSMGLLEKWASVRI
ncbi:hypothetical protein AAFF_G00071880 [Aldrovandia affinis]|uniref:Uncharacterized protein n=1 Tax=Aldrovandia affinis TaxID=143900 RepID=A0AAD7RYM8_9TELE|nr:hypothetical protein AAFF_G00071880 [Aldrovandia affinis]